ncbi:Hypothetical predicted protein [Pelobates cultripes]|uniref:Uncharacterized protein n=1 Tax=Pelobates cultripes TaxID=61616 RepID=A0AAD1S5Q1_PELCU|nr:Hypothetical predicted protein [Pelobates cultripes]
MAHKPLSDKDASQKSLDDERTPTLTLVGTRSIDTESDVDFSLATKRNQKNFMLDIRWVWKADMHRAWDPKTENR